MIPDKMPKSSSRIGRPARVTAIGCPNAVQLPSVFHGRRAIPAARVDGLHLIISHSNPHALLLSVFGIGFLKHRPISRDLSFDRLVKIWRRTPSGFAFLNPPYDCFGLRAQQIELRLLRGRRLT